MVTLIAGLILLAIPFMLLGLFSDKKKGFVYVLFFLLVFQSILGLLTQVLGMFYYWLIISVMLVADIAVLFYLLKLRKKFLFNLRNIDWVVIFVVIISAVCLFQVHYNYTGKINLATDQVVSYHEVKNMVYPYPYFSDEWYAVSLVQGAIDNHSLPVKNILSNSFFPNLELFFHSFVAQIVLLLGLNPLFSYTALSIFFNALIILLIYLFLRINKIPKLTAGVCSLLALYITSGANLPGLWQFIPLNSGIIFFILSLCFIELKDIKIACLSSIVASLFYPPLFLFYFIAYVTFFVCNIKIFKERLLKTIGYGALALFFILPTFYILLMISPFAQRISYLLSRVFFTAFTAPLVPCVNFYDIIPLPAILLAIFGIYYICKNKKWEILSVFILGLIYWFTYSFTNYRFFSEFERILILTSTIIVIISGFGLKQLEYYVEAKFNKDWYKVVKIAEVVTLAVFLFLVPFYTQGENWKVWRRHY